MFLVDLSPSMGASRIVELPDGPEGETRSVEMTKLEWSLQFVKMKIQEMVCPSCSFESPSIHVTPAVLDIQRAKDGSVWRYYVWL